RSWVSHLARQSAEDEELVGRQNLPELRFDFCLQPVPLSPLLNDLFGKLLDLCRVIVVEACGIEVAVNRLFQLNFELSQIFARRHQLVSNLSSDIPDLDFLFGSQVELPEDYQKRRGGIAEALNYERLLLLREDRVKVTLSYSIQALSALPSR